MLQIRLPSKVVFPLVEVNQAWSFRKGALVETCVESNQQTNPDTEFKMVRGRTIKILQTWAFGFTSADTYLPSGLGPPYHVEFFYRFEIIFMIKM